MSMVLLLGHPASGKSASLRNMNPKETFLIKVINRELLYIGGDEDFNEENKNVYVTNNHSKIIKMLQKISSTEHIKNIIIDDSQYIMAEEFMSRAYEKGFDKFTEIGKHFFDVVACARDLSIIGNRNIVFMHHIDDNDAYRMKPKTIGKMIDNAIGIEGYFDNIILSEYTDDGYKFKVTRGVNDIVRTKMGVFTEEYMDNDLKLFLEKINNTKKKN